MIHTKTLIVLFSFIGFFLVSQTLVLPNPLPLSHYTYNTSSSKKEKYNFQKFEKKAFLFYDIKTEALAEVMYNGCGFIFNNTAISVFPIYFTGQLIKKASVNFPSKIPTQLYESLKKTNFKVFNLTEEDFPILIIYNEKNELCGYAKTTEQIADIDCSGEPIQSKFLRLKILTEEKNKSNKPYAHKPIFVIGSIHNDTVAKTTTNQNGDFEAVLPNLNQDYIIRINEKDPTLKFMVVSSQSGRKIGNFNSIDNGFEYKILQQDLIQLPDIYFEEEVALQLKPMDKSNITDFVITENLFYELGEAKLSQGSKDLLNKMIDILRKRSQFNILVTSHTDAQGDEAANLKLSIKRSEEVVNYFISKGIPKERLTAEGKGETQIRNRCVNDIECSDKEHEYNRRTEFKFTKK
jgi:outer membrane protein OmpA-like peptidoglycan-associated protein